MSEIGTHYSGDGCQPEHEAPNAENALDDWEAYARQLEAAIERHRQKVMSLGLHSNSQGDMVWGGQYDAELWAEVGLPDRPNSLGLQSDRSDGQ